MSRFTGHATAVSVNLQSIMMKTKRKVIPVKTIIRLAAVLSLLALSHATVQAAADRIVQDWVVKCEREGEFRDRCFIRQTLTLRSSGEMLFDIAAGYPLGGEYPLLLLSAPLGIYLPAGIDIEVDNTGSHRAVVAYCNHEGCHAYYRMTSSLYRLFRQGRWLNVTFLDGTRRAHDLQLSLSGFSKAIDSLGDSQ